MARMITITPGRILLRDKAGKTKFDSNDRMPVQWPAAKVKKSLTVMWSYGPSAELPSDARTNVVGGGGAYYRVYRAAHGTRDRDVAAVPATRPFWWVVGKVRFRTLEIAGIGADRIDRPQHCVPKAVWLDYTGGSILVAEWLAQGSDYFTWKWSWVTPMVVGRRFVLRLASTQLDRRSQNFASPALVWPGAWARATIDLDLQLYTWTGNTL
jgi:hypothetical protein